MIRVAHLIVGTNVGGAEMMLYNLLTRVNQDEFPQLVVSMMQLGPIGHKIQKLGITVESLDIVRGWVNPLAVSGVARLFREHQIDVVQGWMYHANLLSSVTQCFIRGGPKVVWGIHHTTFERGKTKLLTKVVSSACASLSKSWVDAVVYCSESSRAIHGQRGYRPRQEMVITNGIDAERFRPDSVARASVRKELGISEETTLVGCFARFDPQKDHHGLIKAMKIIHTAMPDVHFVLCGAGIDDRNHTLTQWIEDAGVESVVHLLGVRDDLPRLHAALDIFCLSSAYGEAFPMVLGEAMACGVPCIATDLGDCKEIISNTGIVVPRSPEAFARALLSMLESDASYRNTLGGLARERILSNYSLGMVTRQYEQLYRSVVKGP